MNLDEFTAEVNRLAQERCDQLNSEGHLFRAEHHPYPQSMMQVYFKAGLSPTEALRAIYQAE